MRSRKEKPTTAINGMGLGVKIQASLMVGPRVHRTAELSMVKSYGLRVSRAGNQVWKAPEPGSGVQVPTCLDGPSNAERYYSRVLAVQKERDVTHPPAAAAR